MTLVDRRTLLKTGLLAPAAAAAGTFGKRVAQAAPRVTRTLASGLDTPWGIAFLPSGEALATERDSGWISLVSRGGGVTRVRRLATRHVQESGLMGIALHPQPGYPFALEVRIAYELREAGLEPGDVVQVRAAGRGRVEVERRKDIIDEFAGKLSYPPGYLDRLRDEWDR